MSRGISIGETTKIIDHLQDVNSNNLYKEKESILRKNQMNEDYIKSENNDKYGKSVSY